MDDKWSVSVSIQYLSQDDSVTRQRMKLITSDSVESLSIHRTCQVDGEEAYPIGFENST